MGMNFKKIIIVFSLVFVLVFPIFPSISSAAAFKAWEKNGIAGSVMSLANNENDFFRSGYNKFGDGGYDFSTLIEKIDPSSGDVLATNSLDLAGVASVVSTSYFDGENLYVAGNYIHNNQQPPFRGFVAKFDRNLNLIWSVNHAIIGAITGLAVDGNAVYFSGYDAPNNVVRWVIKKINAANGSPIGDPIIVNNARPYDLKIKDNRIFIVGTDYSDGQRPRIEIRRNNDLSLIVEPIFSAGGNNAYHKSLSFWPQPGGEYHGFFVMGFNGSNWRVEKRTTSGAICSQRDGFALNLCRVSFGETYLRYEYNFNLGRAIGNALRFGIQGAVLAGFSALTSSLAPDIINMFQEIAPIPADQAWMWALDANRLNPFALLGNIAHAGFLRDAWDGFQAVRGNNVDMVIKQEGGEGYIDIIESNGSPIFDSISSISSVGRGDQGDSVFFLVGTKNGRWLTQRREGLKGSVNWNQYGGDSGSPMSSAISIEGNGDQLILYSAGAIDGIARLEKTKNKLEPGDIIRSTHLQDIAKEINRVRVLSGERAIDFSEFDRETESGKVIRAEHFTVLKDAFKNRCSEDPIFESEIPEPNMVIRLDNNLGLINELALRLNAGICRVYEFRLNQNYPNPFDGQTTIPFELETEADISLIIYNNNNQEIGRLLDDIHLGRGEYKISFSGLNNNNLPSGSYTYKLHSSIQGWLERRMTVVR